MRTFQLSVFVILSIVGATLGAILFVAVWPYLPEIGKVATGFIFVLFGCSGVLVMAGTYHLIMLMAAKRRSALLNSRIIVAGDVVAAWSLDGTFIHLSAQHEAAKVQPLQIAGPAPREEIEVDDSLILEYFAKGQTLENICKLTGATYYKVQRVTSEAKKVKKAN
jgi:hypothetical protein